MGTVPVFASATEAMQMVRAGLDYLAATDATAMAAEEQARCLRALEQVNSVATAARTSILGAYTAGQGYTADADYSPRAWLINKTGVTRGVAVAYTAWVRRSEAHPRIAAALAAGEISESVARTLCLWTDKLPEDRREDADKILADGAVSGLKLADLAGLFAEIYERYRAEEPDEDKVSTVRAGRARLGSNQRPPRCERSPVIFRARAFWRKPGQTLLFNSVERASGTFTRDVISQIPPI